MQNCEHRYAEAQYDSKDIVFNEKSGENEPKRDDKGVPASPKKIVCRECGKQLPSNFPALGIGGRA